PLASRTRRAFRLCPAPPLRMHDAGNAAAGVTAFLRRTRRILPGNRRPGRLRPERFPMGSRTDTCSPLATVLRPVAPMWLSLRDGGPECLSRNHLSQTVPGLSPDPADTAPPRHNAPSW